MKADFKIVGSELQVVEFSPENSRDQEILAILVENPEPPQISIIKVRGTVGGPDCTVSISIQRT